MPGSLGLGGWLGRVLRYVYVHMLYIHTWCIVYVHCICVYANVISCNRVLTAQHQGKVNRPAGRKAEAEDGHAERHDAEEEREPADLGGAVYMYVYVMG